MISFILSTILFKPIKLTLTVKQIPFHWTQILILEFCKVLPIQKVVSFGWIGVIQFQDLAGRWLQFQLFLRQLDDFGVRRDRRFAVMPVFFFIRAMFFRNRFWPESTIRL